MTEQELENERVDKRLHSMELRLQRIEQVLETSQNIRPYYYEDKPDSDSSTFSFDQDIDEERGLETRFGTFGLAFMGNIVLFLGISFLAQYIINLGQPLISAILGYLSAATILFLAKYLKNSNVPLASMFKINGQILLFYLTVRLHFFSENPLIQQKNISLMLLFLIIVYQVYIAIHSKSQTLSVISVVFVLAAALLTDSTHLMMPIIMIVALASVYYYYRFRWEQLVLLTIIFTYITYFLWLCGNPLLNHPMALISEHHNGITYLFLLAAVFSSILFFRQKDKSSDDFYIGLTFTNGILFTLLLLIIVLRFFKNDYVALFSLITICCLIFSTVLHSRSDWNFATAFYSLYGFMAMSIAIYGLSGFPKVYLLLSIQSLIVVSMALWFRNRLIVVMNSLLFLGILLIYLFSSTSVNSSNFSFAIIALISARIVNWQSSRLEIETHLIRNLYLFEGFVMILVALFHAVPKQFITLSWIMATLIYFLLSVFLKNVKYRYMALGTMVCAALYLFLIDLASIELIYRILALLFLSVISIGISTYYSSRISKKGID